MEGSSRGCQQERLCDKLNLMDVLLEPPEVFVVNRAVFGLVMNYLEANQWQTGEQKS